MGRLATEPLLLSIPRNGGHFETRAGAARYERLASTSRGSGTGQDRRQSRAVLTRGCRGTPEEV
jgi:hypothetical protein